MKYKQTNKQTKTDTCFWDKLPTHTNMSSCAQSLRTGPPLFSLDWAGGHHCPRRSQCTGFLSEMHCLGPLPCSGSFQGLQWLRPQHVALVCGLVVKIS
ncbi:hypothetical protein AOLI_G00322800 [Acnodon oligacanthus]